MTHGESLRTEWGRRIRAARTQRGMAVVRLGQLVDIDPSGISRIERGLQGLGDEGRIRIAQALGVRVEDLFVYPETRSEPECPPVSSAQDEAPSPQPETLPTTPRARTRRASRRPAPPARAAAPSATEAAPSGTEAAS